MMTASESQVLTEIRDLLKKLFPSDPFDWSTS
jgi:hypothetical protein